jgi:predicted LPLAT superfamily acyltransferase
MARFLPQFGDVRPVDLRPPVAALEEVMTVDPYRVLVGVADCLGPWLFAAVSRIIAAGYFLFSRRRVAESRRFYAILYPRCGRLFHLWCAFRQYQHFTTIHYDRFLSNRGRTTGVVAEGGECLDAAIGGSGAILLMSHLGNWEMAARLLMHRRRDLRLLLYMGIKEKEGVERTQKDELRRAGITIIGAEQDGGSPFTAVDGIRLLREGGLVSMAGDIVWRQDQRRLPVDFLGHVAYLPEAPFIFAMISGAPIHAFFAFRTGTNSYRCTLSEPITVRPDGREERGAAVAAAAQRYADLLASALRSHPLEWYHFDRFLHEPVAAAEGGR